MNQPMQTWTAHAASALLCSALLMAGSAAHAQAPVPPDAADAARGLDVEALKREMQAAVLTAEKIDLRANKQALREGESLVLSVDLPRAGYLNVVSINPQGVPTVLFPNQLQSDNKVQAGTFSFPDERMGFDLQASAPYGPSLIVAFLTQDKLDLYATGVGGSGGAAHAGQGAAGGTGAGGNAGNSASANGAAGTASASAATTGSTSSTSRASMGDTLAALAEGVHQFALLSMAGRDLIHAFGMKDLIVAPSAHAPMAAGMTTVVVCAKTGPCSADPAALSTGVTQILDAFAPGILLEPEDKTLAKEITQLRPVSGKGLMLTKASEGFVPRLYEDAAGYCTIAYGHLLRKERCGVTDKVSFPRGVSEPRGSDMLQGDMGRAQRAVMSMVKVPLTDGQYAALCDFAYNVGTGNLQRSTLLKAINAGEHRRVPFQLRRWTLAGGREYRGLRLRREREIALYFEGGSVPTIVPKGEETSPLDIRSGEAGTGR